MPDNTYDRTLLEAFAEFYHDTGSILRPGAIQSFLACERAAAHDPLAYLSPLAQRRMKMADDESTVDKKTREYLALVHAVQTGVQTMLEFGDQQASPKHLRVGVNAAMSDHSALARLLLAKGLFTQEEYLDSCIASMKEEVARYEQLIRAKTGADVSLL